MHQRRRSKDDAWVDILILESNGKNASGEQRLAVQRETRKSRSKSDPEQARVEIQRAIDTGGSFISSIAGEAEKENEQPTPRPRTPVYQHPTYSQEEVEEVMHIPKVIPPVIHVRSPTVSTLGVTTPDSHDAFHSQGQHFRHVQDNYSEQDEESYAEDDHVTSQYDDEVSFPSPATSSREDLTPKATTSPPLPPPPSPYPPRNLGSTEPPKAGVSNLIQIFQKKDEAAVAIPPPNPDIRPSRLPVIIKPPTSALEITAPLELFQPRPSGIPVSVKPVTPPQIVSPNITPSRSPVNPPIPSLAAPPPPLETLPPPPELLPRVPSPARYVHGAPLHNVLEDDEYEE